jgi:hypothetical protein
MSLRWRRRRLPAIGAAEVTAGAKFPLSATWSGQVKWVREPKYQEDGRSYL